MDRQPATRQQRRLTRSRTDRVLGGVAAGMARYFGVDVALMRLIWVLVGFTGMGVVAYIVAWIVIPEAPEGEEGEEDGAAPEPVGVGASARLILGAVLILVGFSVLLDRVFPWFDELAVPIALIAAGAGVLVYALRR